MRRHRLRTSVALIAWLLVLGAAGAGLHLAGGGALHGPRLAAPSSWRAWLEAAGPVTASFTFARVAALGLAWYLLTVGVVTLCAECAGGLRAITILQLITLPGLGRMLAALAGTSIVTTTAASALMSASAVATTTEVAATADTATMTRDDSFRPPSPATTHDPSPAGTAGTADAAETAGTAGTTGTAATADLPAAAAGGTGGTAGLPAVATATHGAPGAEAPNSPPSRGSAEPPKQRPSAPEPAPRADTWLVRPGDNFWTIAARVLAHAWGRRPTLAEIDSYWVGLIEANRSRLADPHNADLIFPGQRFSLPPVPTRRE